MTLFTAALATGVFLVLLGCPLMLNHPGFVAGVKAMPRAKGATYLFFGAGTLWFLFEVSRLSAADFGDYRTLLLAIFAVIAIGALRSVPDFLAVRGWCVLMLMAAGPLLDAAYMRYDYHARCLVSLVYVGILLALWLGAQPWRMRDFLGWLFARPARSRRLGAALTGYGLLLTVVGLTA